jgi:hypothetical protein
MIAADFCPRHLKNGIAVQSLCGVDLHHHRLGAATWHPAAARASSAKDFAMSSLRTCLIFLTGIPLLLAPTVAPGALPTRGDDSPQPPRYRLHPNQELVYEYRLEVTGQFETTREDVLSAFDVIQECAMRLQP